LAFVDSCGYRLVNRRRADVTDRYPELGFLDHLPAGIVLDGEVVVLRQGKPDFGLLLSRNQARASLKIQSLARTFQATYLVFDLLISDSSRFWPYPCGRAGSGWSGWSGPAPTPGFSAHSVTRFEANFRKFQVSGDGRSVMRSRRRS
jgi:hypothetical protein